MKEKLKTVDKSIDKGRVSIRVNPEVWHTLKIYAVCNNLTLEYALEKVITEGVV
jgi:hypothetical protein